MQQLGTAHLVYPGAHHRRFEHGLGAYHVAGRMAASLRLDAPEAGTLRAGALLHDVGHGPFSHAFDEMLREEGRRHEEMSVDLVRWGPLADLLRQGGLDPVAVSDAILGQGPLAPLVAGSLDADRIDYLLRDAHYTGVRSSVDADRLTEVLARDATHGVVLESSGQIAAEALLTMRFLMYPAVYLHHTVRCSEAMLQAAVRSHLAEGVRLRDLERDTDDVLLARLRSAGGVAAELVARLDERRLYKRAFEGGPSAKNADALVALAAKPRDRRRLEAEIAADASVPGHHVVLDVPRPPRFREAALHVRTPSGTRPLAEVSRLVRVLQEARMDHWRAWVFAPKADREKVAAAAQRVLASL
ncbi:MAG: HD domain-containing protein [Halobacteriales archaeon]|nr:HD domain-containing protein [Halobacteriales archaeon]